MKGLIHVSVDSSMIYFGDDKTQFLEQVGNVKAFPVRASDNVESLLPTLDQEIKNGQAVWVYAETGLAHPIAEALVVSQYASRLTGKNAHERAKQAIDSIVPLFSDAAPEQQIKATPVLYGRSRRDAVPAVQEDVAAQVAPATPSLRRAISI